MKMWLSTGEHWFCLWVSKVFQGSPCGLLGHPITDHAVNASIKIPINSKDEEQEYNVFSAFKYLSYPYTSAETFPEAFNFNTLLAQIHLLPPFAASNIIPLELLCIWSLCKANKCSQTFSGLT